MVSLSSVAVRDVSAVAGLLCDKAAVPRDTMNGSLLYSYNFYSCILLNVNSCFMCPMICALQPYSTAENDIYKASCGYLVHFYIVLNMYLRFCILLHCFTKQTSWDTDSHQAGKNSSALYRTQNFLRVLIQPVPSHILSSCLVSVLILSSFLCLGLLTYLFPSNFRAETISTLSHACSYVATVKNWNLTLKTLN